MPPASRGQSWPAAAFLDIGGSHSQRWILIPQTGAFLTLGIDIPLGTLFGSMLFLLLCSAFFSGTETALMSVNRYRLRHLASTGHRGARFAENLLKRPDRLIGVILFCNNLVNNALAGIVTVAAMQLGGPAAAAIGTVVVTIAVLIFGEVTPKTYAAVRPERVAFTGAYFYHFLLRFLLPVSWSVALITLFSNGLLRLLGMRPEDSAGHNLTIEELRTILAESGALLPRKRHEIMMRVLELGEITVEDIMIPQSEVVGIDLTDDWEKIIATMPIRPISTATETMSSISVKPGEETPKWMTRRRRFGF